MSDGGKLPPNIVVERQLFCAHGESRTPMKRDNARVGTRLICIDRADSLTNETWRGSVQWGANN